MSRDIQLVQNFIDEMKKYDIVLPGEIDDAQEALNRLNGEVERLENSYNSLTKKHNKLIDRVNKEHEPLKARVQELERSCDCG